MNYIRKSVPTGQLQIWYDIGWSYVRPDFDAPNHSLIEWCSEGVAAYPSVPRGTVATPK